MKAVKPHRKCEACGADMFTRKSDRPRKPQMTRKLVFMTDPTEGVVRVYCRTKLVRMTPKELGYHLTEFLYRAGMLPVDSPEPDELEEA